MLKDRKKIRRILIVITTVIMILGFFIKFTKAAEATKTTKEIYTPMLKLAQAGEYRLAAATIGLDHGTIKPIYRPKWEKITSSFDTENKTLTIQVKGSAYETQSINDNSNINYSSDVTSTLLAEDITVYVDGIKVTNAEHPKVSVDAGTITTNVTSGKQEVTHSIVLSDFEEDARQTDKKYKEWSGNISLLIAGRGQNASTYLADVLKDDYGNQNMMETDEDGGTWKNITIGDDSTDHNTQNKMFTDFIKPELTYIYSDGNINHTDKTLTVDFSVTDKYFNTSSVLDYKDAIEINLIDTDPNVQITNDKITKELIALEDITEEREDSDQPVKIGEKYRLIIKGLEQTTETGGFIDYSGPMSITFPEGMVKDKSNNTNITKTITIGINEPDHTGNQEIVDVVDPIWSVESADIDTGIVKLRVKDKYLTEELSKFELAKEDIKIVVNGVESTAIVKTLDGPNQITKDKEYEYVLTLLNIAPEGNEYTEFTPIEPIIGGTAKYRNENGGNITLRVVPGVVTDQYGNSTKQQELLIGNVDLTEPEIYYIQKTADMENNKETIVFNVTDKNYNLNDPITVEEMSIWVDGTQVDTENNPQVTKHITKSTPIKTILNGKTVVVGHQYVLEIGSIVETDQEFINSNRTYRELSGTLEIRIDEHAASDMKGNGINPATTTITDTTDLIKPEVIYKFATSDINKDDKTFTMIFDMVDKYYNPDESTTLTITDLAIQIEGEEPDWNEVTRSLQDENITELVNGENKVVGKRYTLKLSNLEQLQVKEGDNYLDYSGVITVGIPANKMKDELGNGNIAKTITSGVNIPGGTGTGEIVDVVDPLVEKGTLQVDEENSKIIATFKITDRYFENSTLTKEKIKLYANGNELTDFSEANKTLTSKELTEERVVEGETVTVQYGIEYTLTLTNCTTKNNHLKAVIPADVVTDTSGNKNKAFDYVLYTTLVSTENEGIETTDISQIANIGKEGFLGNTNIQRRNIDNVTFVSSTENANDTAWDVSTQQDKSILAWYEEKENGTVKVYIGSDSHIYANENSKYLFAGIGVSDNCTATETITNIELLNTNNVTNMQWMFQFTGYKAMKSLDLKNNFDTKNVTDMRYMFVGTGLDSMTTLNLGSEFNTEKVIYMAGMFQATGFNAMTSLDLGEKFDTSSVEYMGWMFAYCGHNSMTSINLRDKFNTAKVKDMRAMFAYCGYTAMTSLDLGEKFDTSSVTEMQSMFKYCGYTAMASLNLGKNFNTSSVVNMSSAFQYTGYTAMTSLDLGDKFYTTSATDMSNMFEETGSTLMTSLDLGPAFTRIAGTNTDMFKNTGKDGEITIHVPEQIYLDKNDFKLNTDATSSAINYTTGTINPKYRTEWIKEESVISEANKNITITLRGRTNAEAGVDFTSDVESSLTTENIHVYFDGEEATTITKEVATATTVTNETTGANDVLQVITLSNLEEGLRQQGKLYKEWTGNISLKIDKKTLKDKTYSNQNLQAIDTTGEMEDIIIKEAETYDKNTAGKMFTDYTKPEFTYIYTDGNINYTDKTLTVEFSITDKYFDNTKLNEANAVDNILVNLIDTDPNVTIPNEKITKELTMAEEIMEDRDGDGVAETKIGEKYKLVIKGLQQQTADGGYKDYSGPMSISIPAGVAKDKTGNKNIATTITIGVNEPDNTGDKEIVDVVDPLWKAENINIDYENKKVTVDLIGTDKYYVSNTLDTSKIKVCIDKEEVKTTTNVVKELSEATPLKETRTIDGVSQEVQYGIKYTLTLSNWEETEKQEGKEFFEWSGTTKIEIAADTIKDNSNNTSKKQEFTLGHVDFIKPKIEKVSSSKDPETKTETIIFNVLDKYLYTDDEVTVDEISVYVDNELVPENQIVRTLTKESEITAEVNGVNKVVGNQYKLVLSEFEQPRSSIDYDREYSDWSGDVKIVVAEGAVRDTNTPTPNLNEETTIEGDFVDFIKPNATYKYTESDIDYNGKTFTMVFDVTDKYYTSGTLRIGDLNILIDGETPNWDNTGVHGVVKELTVEDRKNTVKGVEKVIGKRYTLKLSHLEQLEKLVGKETMDYSGVITVAIPKDKLADTSGNKNNAVTLTSGIDIKGAEIAADGTVVDVVDPIWERVSSSASAANQTATIIVKGTDKYFASSNLTSDKVKVVVNGNEVSENVSINVGTATPVYATDETTRIGDQYTIIVSGSGLVKNANQIAVRIQPGAITDNSGNTNKTTDLLVFNALRETNTEVEPTGGFLGSANSTNERVNSIERQNIDNVTFINNIPSSVYDKSADAYLNDTVWDVSAMQDKSILAWYTTNENGTLKVYIGSDNEIFGNYDSSYLFNGIGYSNECTSAETITNIKFLNVGSVNNMRAMFRKTGHTAMTKLDLGNNFDTTNASSMAYMFAETGVKNLKELSLGANFNTENVVDMEGIFWGTGYDKLISLNLGKNFNTNKVTNMSNAFKDTGYTSMISLDLGEQFNTSKVTNMSNMFANTGYTAMTTLVLGENFNTSEVTNMSGMFSGTGYTAMASLDLGDKFDTKKVTNLSNMFKETGYTLMTALDLGDKFYTTNATNMSNMFESTGNTLMTSLDLGPAFTKIAETNTDMFKNIGKYGATTIYASEQIYLDKNNFKLDTETTESAIEYTRGTINPKYRTEWIKEESVISEANKNITITLRGRTNPDAGIDHTSNLTSTLTPADIHVYFDGEEATTISKDLAESTVVANEVTGANDVLQVLTLSNLEEELRQQGKNYKEWSGNISLKINKKTLADIYGNQNLRAIDTTGEMVEIIIKEAENISENTAEVMFTDYIKPEFTYEYSNTTIDYENKNVTVVFDVTDKYFKESTISLANTTIEVDGVEPDWTKVTRTFNKKQIDADQTVGNIIYKANGDIYTTVNGKQQKIGERYELKLEGLETQNGEGYSGTVTLAFPEGVITDISKNKNVPTTITIGVDNPENHEDHKDPKIVDVVNPLWSYGTSSINRVRDGAIADTVDIAIIGSDKYYNTNTLTTDKIKVYVDDKLESSITKSLEQITDADTLKQLATKQGLADIDNLKFVGYKLTLGEFGTINGETKIVIDAGTIQDTSGNKNLETTIPVGNPEWVEAGDSKTNQKYPAFRNNIVDFIKPVIKYTYSAVEGTENPTIDYEAKTLTVKFTVTDKYIREDSIMNEDGTLNKDNIRIKVAGTDLTDQLHTTVTSQALEDGTGTEYTFVVSNFELVYNEAKKYQDYSGEVTFVFAENKVDDTSGNKNNATTITLDYDDGDDTDNPIIVDVIDPLIERTEDNLSIVNANNGINRDLTNETGTVSVRIRASDKYLDKGILQNAENVAKMKVKVVKPDGETVYPETITKQVSQISKQATSVTYQITLGNFGENEGVTSIIIPEGVIIDKYGNTNRETEVLVGNATWQESGDSKGEYTAFKNSIVDFTRPIWEYSTSSITRNRDAETGTVTVKILGRDKYYLKDTLTTDKIFVYVDNTNNPNKPVTTITKELTKITDTAELDGADTGYILTLGNFGTYDGAVKISIADNTIKDTSGNGNKITELPVGNSEWVETDVGDNADNPKYPAFRNDIVDFIKPTIKYQYAEGANPVIDQENKQVSITFDVVDTNFLESDILTADDIKQILVDKYDVTETITKQLTMTDITDGSGNGIRYTLTLSNFELNSNLANEIFRRHSGMIELVIGAGKVKDTSGNMNIETKIIVDNDNGDDEENYVRVDFIKPKLFFKDKFISYAKRYATITISGTDRFYDFNTKLKPEDISIYALNRDGDYVQRTDLPITINPVKTQYGYDFEVSLGEFEEEFRQLKISIAANKIGDLDGHTNDATDIFVDLDNRKPIWKYVSTDTSEFESNGKISFIVKGQDTFLDVENSNLDSTKVKIFRDGVDITKANDITVEHIGTDTTEISKSYKIDVTGLTEVGIYSLVLEKGTLVDEFGNKSNTTTISFSKSALSTNTDNYTMVTYHATPDFEQVDESYVHELMNVNKSGTNYESTTYRASSIAEIYDGGKNELFAEPFKYSNGTQTAYSFKGWAEANEKGFSADDARIYSLYEDIPNTVTHLNAIWQEATVIFVSKDGDNSNDGKSPETPVNDLKAAYSKFNSTAKASANVIVIMDKIEWNSTDKLTGNATITSLYAGVDYRNDGAELEVSSNMNVEGDIIFDNIKLYSTSTTVSDGRDYLAKGDYSNVLITNYGDITLGRGITTPDGKYTFGAIVGGNYKEETTKGTIGVHTVIVETGKYNDIIVGSSLNNQTTAKKYVSHQIMLGTMKEAAISRNSKLTITGYLAMGEVEDRCYPFNTSGSQDDVLGYDRYYASVRVYSVTFTGDNKFAKASEDASIFLRSINGFNDGKVKIDMYGGNITGNIYAGARLATTKANGSTEQPDINLLNFYGGQITGDIFGHGSNDSSVGNSIITLAGNVALTGNVFGGSNATAVTKGKITGNTTINITSSITINGNVYGSSRGVINNATVNVNTGLITGNTNINLNVGTVSGDVFGGGYNSGATGTATININNGQVTGSIYGGAYQNQVQTSTNINVLGGTVKDVYGGNVLTSAAQLNADNSNEDTNIIIGSQDIETSPTITGIIYGNGKYDSAGNVKIELIKCATVPTVYGGSNGSGRTATANIYLKDMTVDTIYGGSKDYGTVTTSNIYLQSGTASEVYGGGYGSASTTTSNVQLEGSATVSNIYGGANRSGNVTTSNVTLKSGKATNVFGGGNYAGVGTANVTLDGITIDSIHGGSKNSGNTTNTNVVLNSGEVDSVYGGGYNAGATNAKVTQNGGTVNYIFGGAEGGLDTDLEVTNATVNINGTYVKYVYGGNRDKGYVKNATINITGAARIAEKLYGGGFQSNIGNSSNKGSATINIAGGTIYKDIMGGSESGTVYGTTNINIGIDAITDKTLKSAPIYIEGNIYGAGDSINADYSNTTVYGSTNITLYNNTSYPISFARSIFGSGKGANYDSTDSESGSVIRIKNFGTARDSYKMVSLQRTDKVYIQNSYLELTGAQDKYNYYKNTSYTLNRITNGLALLDNSTLYTQRGFNMVGGFESLLTTGSNSTTKETATIANDVVTKNVDNRIYTFEGVNLIFAKKEGELADKYNEDIWGDVNGMAFFGMYRINRATGKKEYDIYAPGDNVASTTNTFANGTFIEGRHKANHDITVDGFYTNVDDGSNVVPQVIDVVGNGTYYDWIIGTEIVDYTTSLMASTYSTYSMAELELNFKEFVDNVSYNGTTITIDRISTNALDINTNLVDRLTIPTYSDTANNDFGLTMQTSNSGWLKSGTTNLYTDSDGSYDGDRVYRTDNSNDPGKLIFKLYNSINVSESKDLGYVNIVLTGKARTGEDASIGKTFKIIIAVNIQSLYEEDVKNYIPRFTDSIDTELNYTTDSKVNMTYVLYKTGLRDESDVYASGDYRVLSTTSPLPKGTKVTLRDYGQGDSANKVYYYQVASDTDYDATDNAFGSTRYLYNISKFIDIGGTSAKYTNDNSKYYHTTTGPDENQNGYVLEKYDVSIDFMDTGLDTAKLAQETYIELRNTSGAIKYNNGDKDIKYSLYNKKAIMTETVTTDDSKTSYSVFENLTIPFTFNGTLLEQTTENGATIQDTKYYENKLGIAIEIVDEHGERINAPDVQNFRLKDETESKTYEVGADGVIRVPIADGLANINNKYSLTMSQSSVPAGQYIAKIYLFSSPDGEYFGEQTTMVQQINITFINKLLGLVGLESVDGSRIISKNTSLNLDGGNGLDLTVKVGSPTDETNIRVELYKRDKTYTTDKDGNTNYQDISYTKVDLKDYLNNMDGTEWKKPEDYEGQGLITAEGSNEYIVMEKKSHAIPSDEENIETIAFKKSIKEGIETGEYKLVFKAYYNNVLIQTIRKTFIVIP